MNLQKIVEQCQDTLTPAEKQLVRILFSNPAKGAFLSATRLARDAGVHPATVVRLAKKLGFEGYPELRNALQEEIIQLSEPAERIKRRLARAKSQQILSNLIDSEISTLHELPNHIKQNDIDQAARVLIKAQHIYIFAQGNATALAMLMDRRIRRSGLNTILLTGQGRDLAERLLTINQHDVLLAFAFHTRPPGLALALKRSAATGATSLLISDSLSLLPSQHPTLLLAAPRGEESEFLTLTVPMAICNALILTMAQLDKGHSLQVLDDLVHIISDIECEDEEFTPRESHP